MEKLQITLPFQAGQSQRYTTNTDLYAQSDGCEHEDLDTLFGTQLSTKSSQQDSFRQPQVNTLVAPEAQSHTKQHVTIKKLRITLPFKAGQFQAYTTNTDLYAQSDGCEHENLDTLFGIKSSVKSSRSANSHRSKPNSLPTRVVRHQIKEQRYRRWWHQLEDVDPISLEPLAELEYPPFKLKSSDDSSNGSVRHISLRAEGLGDLFATSHTLWHRIDGILFSHDPPISFLSFIHSQTFVRIHLSDAFL